MVKSQGWVFLPFVTAILLAAAILLIGGATVSIMSIREEYSALAHENLVHCHKAKGTPEWHHFGCDKIEWGKEKP